MNLHEKMYEEDTDGKTLNMIDVIAEEVEAFQSKIVHNCEILVEEGLTRLKKRSKESGDLISSIENGIKKSETSGAELINNLNVLIEENYQSEDLSVKITELEEQLMEIEVTLNESNDLGIRFKKVSISLF